MERFYTVQTYGSVYEYGDDIRMDKEAEVTFNIDQITFFIEVDEAPGFAEVHFSDRMFIMETDTIVAITSTHGVEFELDEDWGILGN